MSTILNDYDSSAPKATNTPVIKASGGVGVVLDNDEYNYKSIDETSVDTPPAQSSFGGNGTGILILDVLIGVIQEYCCIRVVGRQRLDRLYTIMEPMLKPSYETLRVVNTIAFTVNAIFLYGIMVMGGIIFAMPTNSQLYSKYQTLVTPTSTMTSVIWTLIFISQAVWVVQQYINYKNKSYYNVTGMQYKYLYVVIVQCIYTICFSHEYLFIATFLLVPLLLYLLWDIVLLNRNGANVDDEDEEYPAANEVRRSKDGKSLRYWFEEFPFAVHFGYVCFFAFTVNINMYAASLNRSIEVEYHLAVVSLYSIAIVTVFLLFSLEFIAAPAVIACGMLAIHSKLQNNATNTIVSQYTTQQIRSVLLTSAVIGLVIVVALIFRIAYSLLQKYNSTDATFEKAYNHSSNNNQLQQQSDPENATMGGAYFNIVSGARDTSEILQGSVSIGMTSQPTTVNPAGSTSASI